VNARTGPGFDNIVSLKGISYNSRVAAIGWDRLCETRSVDTPEHKRSAADSFPMGRRFGRWPHITTGTGGGTNANFVQEMERLTRCPAIQTARRRTSRRTMITISLASYTTISERRLATNAYTPGG
jgi:hypothetical protein